MNSKYLLIRRLLELNKLLLDNMSRYRHARGLSIIVSSTSIQHKRVSTQAALKLLRWRDFCMEPFCEIRSFDELVRTSSWSYTTLVEESATQWMVPPKWRHKIFSRILSRIFSGSWYTEWFPTPVPSRQLLANCNTSESWSLWSRVFQRVSSFRVALNVCFLCSCVRS